MNETEYQKKPANSSAEMIVKLEQHNKDLDVQILDMAKLQAKNNLIIQELQIVAEWTFEATGNLAETPLQNENLL